MARRPTSSPTQLPGAVRAAFPRYISPSAPTLRPTAPSGPGWLHEIKFDGYRVQAHVRGGTARIFTRNGFDWTDRFPSIARAVAALPVEHLVLDGEAVVLDERGMPDMARLRSSLAGGRGERFVCFAFDILYLDSFDLRPAPLIERKQLLGAEIRRISDEGLGRLHNMAARIKNGTRPRPRDDLRLWKSDEDDYPLTVQMKAAITALSYLPSGDPCARHRSPFPMRPPAGVADRVASLRPPPGP